MWKGKELSLESIGIQGRSTLSEIGKISTSRLSVCDKNDKIITAAGRTRAKMDFHHEVGHGGHANIYSAHRYSGFARVDEVVCKEPKSAIIELTQEAILQWYSQLTLESFGFGWAIPRVSDVFLKGGTTWFSMEHIQGQNILQWIGESMAPDQDVLLLICQLALLLGLLQRECGLDHRDLKVDNLMMRKIPCKMEVILNGRRWKYQAPFQVVILDFGFACLGSLPAGSDAVINLGDILPPMDPCPKEGRDMFQFFVSLVGLGPLRERLSPSLQEILNTWLLIDKKKFGTMARRWSGENWVQLVTGQRDFRAMKCSPEQVLDNCFKLLTRNHLSTEVL